MAKIGQGHLAAMGRLGLREARELGNPGGNAVQQTEYGLYGTMTQGEVAAARRDERSLDEEPTHGSSLSDRLAAANDREAERQEMTMDQERDIEMDRD